jgi:hypothetical protein
MPKKELPPVALFRQEKLPFFTAGFPLQSGLRHSESQELPVFKARQPIIIDLICVFCFSFMSFVVQKSPTKNYILLNHYQFPIIKFFHL